MERDFSIHEVIYNCGEISTVISHKYHNIVVKNTIPIVAKVACYSQKYHITVESSILLRLDPSRKRRSF